MDENMLQCIAGYCAGKLDKEEAASLERWLAEDPANRKILEQYLRTVRMHALLDRDFPGEGEDAWERLSARMRLVRRRRVVRRLLPLAAVLLIALSVPFFLLPEFRNPSVGGGPIVPGNTKATLVMADGSELDLGSMGLKEVADAETVIRNDSLQGLQYDSLSRQPEGNACHTVRVPVTGEYHFVLPDGTRVWLNSASELSFPLHFTGDRREVRAKGEVYFEVAHDRAVPFIVHVGKVDVRVSGTRFNVNAYAAGGQVVTTLAEGAVSVSCGGREERLVPGVQAVTDPRSGKTELQKVDTDLYLSWVDGVFEYEDMPLAEIARQLSRWYDVEFVFRNAAARDRHFTGMVRRYEVLDHALEIIGKTTDIRFSVRGRTVEVR